MAVNWLEVALIVALNGVFLLGLLALGFRYVRKRLFPEAEQWMGGAIGRFMQSLSERAVEEEGQASSPSSTGALSLGGIPIGAIIQAISDPNVQKLIGQFINRGGSGGGGW